MSKAESQDGFDQGKRVAETLVVGGLTLPNRVFLAPMSGVTDLPFRRRAQRFGAGLVVSEMVACETLADGDPETVTRAEGQGIDVHAVQIAGREAHWMAEGARMAEAAGADLIDINMGCPAKRVISGYSGSALMLDLDHALTLIEATVAAVKVPVTVKMRLGWDDNSLNAPELARRAEAAGVAMVTVHGRTRNQFYKGQANWQRVRAVREAISIPLIVNGDITDAASARLALKQSGADGVMIGRGSYGRPWIAGRVAAALADGGTEVAPSPQEIHAMLIGQYDEIIELYGPTLGIRIARKHLGWTFDSCPSLDPGAAATRAQAMTAETPDVVRAAVDAWFEGCARTGVERVAA